MITRGKAIRVLSGLFDDHFGSDKGSDDAYIDFMEKNDLAKFDEDGNTITAPPAEVELLMALGATPQEIVDELCINHLCFPKKLCESYGMKKPRAFKRQGRK